MCLLLLLPRVLVFLLLFLELLMHERKLLSSFLIFSFLLRAIPLRFRRCSFLSFFLLLFPLPLILHHYLHHLAVLLLLHLPLLFVSLLILPSLPIAPLIVFPLFLAVLIGSSLILCGHLS